MVRPHLRLVSIGLVLALVVAASGCSRGGFEDRTARLTRAGRLTTFVVDACGLDGRTIFVVGRNDHGDVLQAVVGLEADALTGVPASTGLTVDDRAGNRRGAFGAEAWQRRGSSGRPPGAIRSSGRRGARIALSGDLEGLTREDTAAGTASGLVPFGLEVRCDRTDG